MRCATLLLLLALAAAPSGAAAGASCVQLFARYDRAVNAFSNSGWGEGPVIPSAIDRAIQRLRAGNCLTGWDDIADLQILGPQMRGTLRGEHGAPIRPTTLQAGVVLGIQGELQARQFFSTLGYRVRSQGAPYLGRRIYIGPFVTEGGLAEAKAVAERAGFVAPYERFF